MYFLDENDLRNLSREDLLQVNKICERLHRVEAHESFTNHCFVILNNAFSNVHFSAELYELAPLEIREQEIPTLERQLIPFFEEHIHLYKARMINGPYLDISTTQSEPTQKYFLKTPLFNAFYDKVQAQNQIWISLRSGNELLACVYSREKEYSERHLAMLCLIQPQLELAWKHWQQRRSLHQELAQYRNGEIRCESENTAAAVFRKRLDKLSPRQWEVTELVAEGKDDQQIGEELRISKRTVQKHLEMVFKALNIHHRTKLAARWNQAYPA